MPELAELLLLSVLDLLHGLLLGPEIFDSDTFELLDDIFFVGQLLIKEVSLAPGETGFAVLGEIE